ncbi:hypothetical protein OG218_13085 [Kineococcus sp. NBC_00420]|uniref:hypothetical protein n=1 Tax=Kineococcus sp. NBC_00420 TaxID=2903564 RepID=UPI002E24154F
MNQDLLDPDAFRASLRAAAGPSSPPDDLIDRARAGAQRRSRRRRRGVLAGGVAAVVVAAGAVLATSPPPLDPAPSTRPTTPALTPEERQQRAQSAYDSAVAAVLPGFGGAVAPAVWGDGNGPTNGWQASFLDDIATPTTRLDLEVTSSRDVPPGLFPTCASTDHDRGLSIDSCSTQRLADGTRVDSGVLTSTVWVGTDGKNDDHQVSVVSPFATATSPSGTRVSAAGSKDASIDTLTLGTTLSPGSPVTVESLRALVSDPRLLHLED